MKRRAHPVPTDATRAFQPTADRGALWLSGQYDDAVRMLRAAVLGGRGLLTLVGESGIGKTVLTYALTDRLRDDAVVVGRLRYPIVEGVDLLGAIAEAFGLPTAFEARSAFRDTLGRFVADAAGAGRRVLLIVDGAETLNAELLLELGRLPHQREADGSPFLSVLIVGPRAVLDALRSGGTEPSTLCYLRPLTREQTAEYILHRLRTAGHRRQLFTPSALRKAWVVSEGMPRAVNALCVASLRSMQQLERRRVTAAMIDRSPGTRGDVPASNVAAVKSTPVAAPRARLSRRWAWLAAALAIGFGVGAIGSSAPIGRAAASLFTWPKARAAALPAEPGPVREVTAAPTEAPHVAVENRPSERVEDSTRADQGDATPRNEPAALIASPVVVATPAPKPPPRADVPAARPRPRREAPGPQAPRATDDRDERAVIDWVLGQGRAGTGDPVRE